MALKTFVKVGGISNLDVARYCAGMGVHQLGFCVDKKSEHFMTPPMIKEITQWISGVEVVIECVNTLESLAEYSSDFIETDIDYLNKNSSRLIEGGRPIICTVALSSLHDIVNFSALPIGSYVLLEGGEGSLSDEEIKFISDIAAETPLVLGYGFYKDNVLNIINNTNLKGISLKGNNKPSAGLDEHEDLMEMLELLSVD